MDTQAFDTLEYNIIKEKLAEHASSNLGIQAILDIEPLDDIEEIDHLLEETADAIELIIKFQNPPLYGIYELEEMIRRASLGGVLENYQFRQIADSLRVSAALKDYVSKMEQDNLIKDEIQLLYTNKRIEAEIDRIILDDETIADDASRTLFNIRRNIKNKTEDIRKRLNAIITDKNNQDKLQDAIVTMRDGRYVVPVKSSSRSSFKGVTHDRSATGQTVYIEPMVVVELNNEIRQLQNDEFDEIRRILKELTELVAQYGEEIVSNQDRLVKLDLTFAKAKMAMAMKATRPILNDDHLIDIRQARHPMLPIDEVVPIDIRLGEGYRALIITGPNTGGKTVSLKTLGLMILMSQSGMFIPADEFSKVGIFKNIYADIGDKQSIELSLSTFSASMTNIVSILEKADEHSLVLFDELGSGTDPTEGAALAMSIIDYLINKQVTVVSTTHYSELKLYAMTTEGVQNASVEFDVKSLRPTFRLIIGSPGKSNAFEISKRLGLDAQILNHAASYISKENRDFESLISEIESDRIEAERNRIEVQKLRQKYESLNKQLHESIDDKKLVAQKEVDDAKEEARRLLDQAREEAKRLIRMAKDSIKETANLDRSYSEITDEYQDLQDQYQIRKKEAKRGIEKPIDVSIGEQVRILSMDDRGIVQTLPDSKGELMVQIGILRFNVHISDLAKVKEEKTESKQRGGTTYRKVLREKTEEGYSQQLDLRGKNVNEAIGDIEKFFDNAILIGLNEVQLIHGKGTGALRKGVTDYLKTSRYVDEYRLGSLKEGGSGVTVVSLK